jgi:drug/metabolite transporter (DMT)-like permease
MASALPTRRAALFMNLGAVCTWALAPPMIHSFTGSFPVNFQNAFRYLAALVVLWPAFLLTADPALLRGHLSLLRRRAGKIIVIALVNYGFQVCYTYSLFIVAPSVMSLLSQTQVVFGVAFAVLFFQDERAFIRRPAFLAGLLCALTGVTLVVIGSPTFGSPALSIGIVVILASASCWALLGSLLRKWVPDVPPQLSLCAVFSVVTPLFVATYAFAHRGFPIPPAPLHHWLILTFSGLLAIGLGHSLFYRAITVVGVSVSASLGLLIPLITSLVSYIAFGDALSIIQIAGAAGLLGGCFLIVLVRFRVRPPREARRLVMKE